MPIDAYRKTDLAAVAELFTASVHGLGASAYDPGQCAAWAPIPPDLCAWRERLAARITLVARDGDALAGFIAYTPEGHIDLLFVAPEQARRGIASQLYDHAERDLIARGAEALTTNASVVAAPFFSRHGFDIVTAQTVQLRDHGLVRFAMRKTLRPPA